MQAKLSEQDVYFGFQLLGIQCDLGDARLFVDRYDQDGDLRLTFFEFQNVLLPLNPVLRDDLDRRSRLDNAISGQVALMTTMTVDTCDAMRRVLRRALELEQAMERLR